MRCRRSDDYNEVNRSEDEEMTRESNNRLFKQIAVGVIIILIAGWVTYVSAKGISMDAITAGIQTRVAVLENVALTIKEDIAEIKMTMKEIRNDQKKRR